MIVIVIVICRRCPRLFRWHARRSAPSTASTKDRQCRCVRKRCGSYLPWHGGSLPGMDEGSYLPWYDPHTYLGMTLIPTLVCRVIPGMNDGSTWNGCGVTPGMERGVTPGMDEGSYYLGMRGRYWGIFDHNMQLGGGSYLPWYEGHTYLGMAGHTYLGMAGHTNLVGRVIPTLVCRVIPGNGRYLGMRGHTYLGMRGSYLPWYEGD